MRRQAEEWKERRCIEEEGDLFDLGGAELENHQGPWVVAAARDPWLVLPERHAAVRPYGWYQPRAAASDARPEPPGEDVGSAVQPQVVGRNRLTSVFLDQRGQRAEVVAFEGPDVAGEKLLAGGIHRRRGVVGADTARFAGRPRPLQRAIDRCHAHAEELGDLLSLPSQDLAKDEGRSLARRKVLQRGHEGEPNGLARHGELRRITLRRKQAIRDGLEPGCLRERVQIRFHRRASGPQIHRPCPPVASLQHVEADVGRDPVEPGTQRGPTLEAFQSSPGSQQGLLYRVLRLERRAQHAVAIACERGTMLFELTFEVDWRDDARRGLHAAHPTGRPPTFG